MVSKETERVRAVQRRKLISVFGEDYLPNLTHEDYPLVKKRLGWKESTFKVALLNLGISETGNLRDGFNTYIAAEEDLAAIKTYVSHDLGVTLATTGCRFGELWRMILQRDTLIIYRLKGGGVTTHSLEGLDDSIVHSIKTWVSYGHIELSYAAARRRWQRAQDKGYISKDAKPHSFRHRAATLAIEEGIDIDTVANFLGHQSTNTTRRYTHPRTLARIGSKLAGK